MSTISLSSGRVKGSLHIQDQDLKMKKKIAPLSRWLVLLAVIILPLAYFTPIWKIKLWAPQYPEGLEMDIWINKLSGSINTINGLNHYIGMANIEESMFPELKYLAYILSLIIILGAVTFVVNRRILLNTFTVTLVLFAAAAMIDMYLWEYRYGHNLNPHAAIKIEGASYQPPLVGYKQLLNFLALSIPAKGGYALFFSGFVALAAAIIQWMKNKKLKVAATAVMILSLFSFSSCSTEPEKLNFNKDDCAYCGMKLVDNRFGALLVTHKGKVFRFDDLNCMINFEKENLSSGLAEKKLIIDFSNPEHLIDATKAYYLKNEELKSPMGGNAAAFEKKDSLEKYFNILKGNELTWDQVKVSDEN